MILTFLFLSFAMFLSSCSCFEPPMIQFFIEKKLIAEFPVEGRRFYRRSSNGASLILERHEGLMLLSRIIAFSPRKGDLMEVKIFGSLTSSTDNTKSVEDFSSILASAFPPKIVSISPKTKEDLEKMIRNYSWKEEKSFSFNPLEQIPGLHPSSSLEAIEELYSSLNLSSYLFEERKIEFLKFLGYETPDEIPKDKEFHEKINYILRFHTESETSNAIRMPKIGTWAE